MWDLDIEEGRTVADMFLDQKGRSLDPAERAYVERMRRSCLSLYQVDGVERGRVTGAVPKAQIEAAIARYLGT